MLRHVTTGQRWSISATSACLREAGFPMTNGNPSVAKNDERPRNRQRT